MKKNKIYYLWLLLICFGLKAQHKTAATIILNIDETTLQVSQNITFINTSKTPLTHVVLNDWNHAFSSKESALAARFSDEFYRAFHFAKEKDKGYTQINNLETLNQKSSWTRIANKIDLIKIDLEKVILPNDSLIITLDYVIKLPNARFTKFGFNKDEQWIMKYILLTPALFTKGEFTLQSNENLDDIANALMDYDVQFTFPYNKVVSSNLTFKNVQLSDKGETFSFSGKNKNEVTFLLTNKEEVRTSKFNAVELVTTLNKVKIDKEDQLRVEEKIIGFIQNKWQHNESQKILITQEYYDREPFYGLNQLPSFFSPFNDKICYELQFLKTYFTQYLKENTYLNPRKDQWIYDGILFYTLVEYIETYYPNLKATGELSQLGILKPYAFTDLQFSEQFLIPYLLMARKNIDQPLTEPKNKQIKFNEQIANKYRAGLVFNYFKKYTQNSILDNSIKALFTKKINTETDFRNELKSNANSNLDWFFNSVVDATHPIDLKIKDVVILNDNFKIHLETKAEIPVTISFLKNDEVILEEWILAKNDSIYTFPKMEADNVILNNSKIVPECNLRNNIKNLKPFHLTNKPLKINFLKDIEDFKSEQLFYIPEFGYNFYDGLMTGLMLNNRTLIRKPFSFSVSPTYSAKTKRLIGKSIVSYNHLLRNNNRLYSIIYSVGYGTSHYAPQSRYQQFVPQVVFQFRDPNLRKNKKGYVHLKYVDVHRENAFLAIDENTIDYSILSIKQGFSTAEGTQTFKHEADLQFSDKFGKAKIEMEYRKLFLNNREIKIRGFAGTFLYRNTNSNFFDFGLDRPTDYLFEYNLLGRSELSGFFSQEYVTAEGGLKSKLNTRFANQWMGTINTTVNVWNWIQIYGDVGALKNSCNSTQYVYDSGIHLNLVPDYFELYFPVYSSNGLALEQANYSQNIRFVLALSPKTLFSLFTRKWF